jgi:hypothetical protein
LTGRTVVNILFWMRGCNEFLGWFFGGLGSTLQRRLSLR